MWKFYIYYHVRHDTGEIFYIGKGSIRTKNFYERAYAIDRRNKIWKRIVSKTDYEVGILCSCQTEDEAFKIEKELITLIGRKDLQKGSLCNLTDGGEGSTGLLISDELRAKRSINSSGPRSEVWINSIRAARKNGGNGGVVKLGDKLSEEWKQNLSKAKMGDKNPHYGKTTKIARKVVGADGVCYPSVSAAAKDLNLNMKTLYNMLTGHRPNKTSLRFENGL
jgi:hypothetical protein